MHRFSVFGFLVLVHILCLAWPSARSAEVRPDEIERASPIQLEWGLRRALVENDCDLALTLIEAFMKKDPDLGLFFRAEQREKGRCLPRNLKKAFKLYAEAHEIGAFGAGYRLGYMHLHGLGTPKDREKAIFWFRRVALRDNAAHDANKFASARVYLSDRPLPAELLAEIDWVWRTDQGSPRKKYVAALRVEAGNDMPRDCKVAKRWLWSAATEGMLEAQFELAHWYFDGTCTARDPSHAKSFLHEAARNGFLPAAIELGRRHMDGRGVRKHDLSAYAWLLSAQARGADVATDLRRLEAVLDDIGKNIATEWSVDPGKRASYP